MLIMLSPPSGTFVLYVYIITELLFAVNTLQTFVLYLIVTFLLHKKTFPLFSKWEGLTNYKISVFYSVISSEESVVVSSSTTSTESSSETTEFISSEEFLTPVFRS